MKKIESSMMLILKGVIINQILIKNEFMAFIIFNPVTKCKPINVIKTTQRIITQLMTGPFMLKI